MFLSSYPAIFSSPRVNVNPGLSVAVDFRALRANNVVIDRGVINDVKMLKILSANLAV
jgi:hypothetical protein